MNDNLSNTLEQPGIMSKGNTTPKVSVIIPCRNEKAFIPDTLDSVLQQDYPYEKLEILVVDGMSEDGTLEILEEYIQKYPFIKCIKNKNRFTPSAMNIGIQHAAGELIVRIDAHCLYPKDYISSLIDWMTWLGADNVGAVLETKPSVDSTEAEAVALVMSHPFGVGNAYFRVGVRLPRVVDTVPFGCYRRDIFDEIGFYDEDLPRGQDNELNSRLEMSGGRIFLVPEIKVTYFSRANLSQAWKMYYQYGYCRPYVNLKLGKPATIRQFIPMIFISSVVLFSVLAIFNKYFLIISAAEFLLYISFCIYFAALLALRNKKFNLFPYIFIGFIGVHFMYGFGYLKALWEVFVLRKKQMLSKSGASITR